MTEISIIMPVYNSESTLYSTLDSVLNQSFTDFELLCVDDGSTDRSFEILNEYQQKDSRVRVFRQSNQFAGVARNNGIAHSVGRYITFLDSDDILLPSGLEKLHHAITTRDVDLVRASAITSEDRGGKVLDWCLDNSIVPSDVFSWMDIPDKIFLLSAGNPWSMIVRRELITENGIVFPSFPRTEDVVFTYLCYLYAKRMSTLNEPVVLYRVQSTGMEKTKTDYPLVPLESRLYLKSKIEELGIYSLVKDSFWYRGFLSFFEQLKKLALVKDFSNAEKYFVEIKKVIDQEKYDFSSRDTCPYSLLSIYPELHKVQVIPSLNQYLSTTGMIFESNSFRFNLGLQPLVSIVIPVYNSERHIRQCLNSLLNQTNTNFEIICVDDGSVDNSLDILRGYEHKFPNLFTVITKENTNAGDARNKGMLCAHGKYLLFLDSDDIFKNTLIEDTTKVMEKSWSDVLIFGVNTYNDKTKQYHSAEWLLRWEYITKKEFSPDEVSDCIFQITTPNPWNKMYKSSYIWENNFKFQSLKRANDALFTYSALISSKKISVMEKRLVNWRTNNPQSLQGSNTNSPTCFIDAYLGIGCYLESVGKYSVYERSYVNLVMTTIVYTFNSLKSVESKIELLVQVDDRLQHLNLLELPSDYYYDRARYKEFLYIMGPLHDYYIGIAYKNGTILDADYVKSRDYLIRASSNGIVEAQRELVDLTMKNDPDSIDSISGVVNGKEFILSLARYYSKSDQFEQAIGYYSLLPENELGDCIQDYTDLLYRSNTSDNLQKCFEICERYSVLNNKDAIFRLAQMYRNGKVVNKDLKKAVELMQLAIDNGHSGAKKEIEILRHQIGE